MLNALELYRKYGQQDRAEAVQAQQMADQQAQRQFQNQMSMVQLAQQQQARQRAMQQAAQQREQAMMQQRNQLGTNAQLQREKMSQAERMFKDRLQQQRELSNAKAKPAQLPASALKLQNETLEELSIADSQEKDLGKYLSQLNEGKLELGFVANPVQEAKNYLNAADDKSSNYASFRAGLEKLRNDSLRLNKGVQTEGDSQRAWNELFQNVTSEKVVKDRLQEIMQINKRAKALKAMQVDLIRSNFGVEPLDKSTIELMPANIGAQQPQQGGWNEQKERRLQELRNKLGQGQR